MQLINPAVYDKDHSARMRASVDDHKQRLRHRNESERAKVQSYFQATSSHSNQIRPGPRFNTTKKTINLSGVEFVVADNFSKLIRVKGDYENST